MKNFKPTGQLSGLATAILFALAVGHPNPASAATLRVTNCNDNGTGSLRSAVFRAANNDTIDLAHLACSRITLTSGQIVIQQQNLSLIGRSRDALTIDGGLRDRVLWHDAPLFLPPGRLRLEHLTIAHGNRTLPDDPREDLTVGGCIRADANLDLRWTRIHHCTVVPGHGGAVAVPFGDATIANSLILANVAEGNEEFQGAAPGIWVRGHLDLDHTRVTANRAVGGGIGGVFAGTLDMRYSLVDHNTSDGYGGVRTGEARIIKSTIADNDAGAGGVGGIALDDGSLIAHSTIARNRASAWGGVSFDGDVTVVNSTIAFNRESAINQPCAGGVGFHGNLHLESTIIASNTCAGTGLDLSGSAGDTVIGSHNLVRRSNLPLPSDTLRVSPRLGTLANNGGPTPTIPLLCGSPAIDRGNNVLHFLYDQRGAGFFRVTGAHTDIGAFEVQNPAACSVAVIR